jgi:ATP-dependent protease ClpP protease subunit
MNKPNKQGNMVSLKRRQPSRRNDDDESDDGELIQEEQQLGYFVKSRSFYQYTVFIDSAFAAPSYYRGVIQMLMNAGEHDSIIFMINSPGGLLSGLLTLLEGLNMTEAETTAVLVGQASSAASMFALHCDNVMVTENATMLCHNISYGVNGKGADVLAHVEHTAKTAEKLIRKTYDMFLSEQEIKEMMSGKEIYLDSDEIVGRLAAREKAQAAALEPEVKTVAKKQQPRKKQA